jgi:predicted metal-dependent enzyme (double-stranded beta helix superfamily)
MTLLASLPVAPAAVSRPLDLDSLVALVRGVAAGEALWAPQVRFGDHGRRWWTRLHADAQVDVWLLTWLPGQGTELHDHGTSAAAFTVVRGRLEEVRAERSGTLTSTAQAAGTTAWVAPGVVHDVRATAGQSAVSIHAYSPPLTRMTYYEVVSGTLRPIRTVESHEPEQELQQ